MTVIKNGCICGKDYYTSTEQCDDPECRSERKSNKPQKLGVIVTEERKVSCCGDYTQYKLSCWNNEKWRCADCLLNELMAGNYKIYWEED